MLGNPGGFTPRKFFKHVETVDLHGDDQAAGGLSNGIFPFLLRRPLRQPA
jgi:hypothetical protein